MPGTDGTFWSNYVSHIKTEHPIISIFYENKIHPYGVIDRMYYLLYLLAGTFYLAHHTSLLNVRYEDYEDFIDMFRGGRLLFYVVVIFHI